MTWNEAMAAMQFGQKVRMRCWVGDIHWRMNNGCILSVVSGTGEFYGVEVAVPARITSGHTESDEWEVVP